MFRIGEFSRLAQVSIKTLHHYDEVGLLRPALVDRNTGYRYYEAAQLSVLHRILILKDLGFSLEEIGQVTRDAAAHLDIKDILRKKLDEARQTISHAQSQVSLIERWLKSKKEDVMPDYDVALKTLEPQLVASARGDASQLGALFSRVAEYIESSGARQAGPGIALYHDPEFTEEGLAIEAAFPISSAIAPTDEIGVYHLPQVQSAACLVYKGAHEDMGEASQFIAKWIEDNAYRISGPNRIVFLNCGDENNPQEWVVETQFPVEKL